jgi:hypothetical protein
MTTFILKLAGAPRFAGIKRAGQALADFFMTLAEAKQMARDAQRRFPFVVE